MELLWRQDDFSRLLLKYSRKLNNQMALASSTVRLASGAGAPVDRQGHAAAEDGAPTASVVIEGKLYTLFGPLEAAVEGGEVRRRYAQLYCGVHDDSEAGT